MRVVAVSHRDVRWPLEPRGAARGRAPERTATIIAVHTADGATGLGEAAPLPGVSIDTLADAARAAHDLASRAPVELATPGHASAIADRITPAPAARFAIETALLAAYAQTTRTSIARLLTSLPKAELALCIVADDAAHAATLTARCLKIKVGSADPDDDIRRVRTIAAAAPHAQLRLDANRGWRADDVDRIVAHLADLPIDFIEEPCPDAHELLDGDLGFRLALDESLIELDRAALSRALASPHLAALILKPTLLGGFARCLEYAQLAHRHGVAPIVTHTLEGPIGTAACHELARAIGADLPVGLAPHAALDRFAEATTCAPTPSCIATHDADTVAAIDAALDRRTAIALLHAKLPADELARQRALVEAATFRDDDAVILFTSGSTGAARGVVLSRTALAAAAAASWEHLGRRADDRWQCTLPLAHAGGLAILVRCRAAGVPVSLAPDPEATLISAVPAQLAEIQPSPRLRAVLLGGAAAPQALVDAAIARGVPVLQTYGLTETFGQVATARVPGGPLVPLPGVTITGGTREAPARLRVRGPMLATRYLDGEPIAPEYETADLGFVEQGHVFVVGRADDVIISGGENVHPAQVEHVLAATPGVRAVAVFGVPDARWGHVVAAALAAPAIDETALAAWHAQLPPHARPRRIALVDALPLLASGKVDRHALAALPTTPVRYNRHA